MTEASGSARAAARRPVDGKAGRLPQRRALAGTLVRRSLSARATALCLLAFALVWLCPSAGLAQLPNLAGYRGDTVAGWTLERVEQAPEYVRLHFHRGLQDAHVEVVLRAQLDTDVGTDHFALQAAPEGFAPAALQAEVLTWLRAIERGEGPNHVRSAPAVDPARVVRMLEGVLGLALLLLVAGVIAERRQARSLSLDPGAVRRHALPLALFTASAALLRVAQGPRIPGFESVRGEGRGFRDVATALSEQALELDPRGSGAAALYELWFALWPREEWALLTLQASLAVLTVPLVYFTALAWLRAQREATWAAAVYAFYPCAAYFAMTEVRPVPGAFFLLLGLVVIGVGIERHRALFVASGGLLAVFATSFHPVLMPAPLVAGLLLMSRRDVRAFRKSPSVLLALATVVAAWAIVLRVTWLELTQAPPGAVLWGGPGALENAWRLALPTVGLPHQQPFNAFLNTRCTPLLVTLCWVFGLSALRSRARRRALVTLGLSAMAMTLPGMAGARYDLPRLQYAAAPLYALGAGVGCVALIQYVVRRLQGRRLRRAVPAGLASAIALSVAISSGPLSEAFVYESERAVSVRALPQLQAHDRACDVWVPPTANGAYRDAPTYLTQAFLPAERWHTLATPGEASRRVLRSLAHDGCAYYYRPSVCWTRRADDSSAVGASGLRPECAAVEDQLVLTPVHVESILARPASATDYRRPRIEVGFFRVRALAL